MLCLLFTRLFLHVLHIQFTLFYFCVQPVVDVQSRITFILFLYAGVFSLQWRTAAESALSVTYGLPCTAGSCLSYT